MARPLCALICVTSLLLTTSTQADPPWRDRLFGYLSGGLVAQDERAAAAHYHALATRWVNRQPRGRTARLSNLLAHLLDAASRQPRGSDPVVANRAILFALTAYANGRAINPDAPGFLPMQGRRRTRALTLRGRRDLAKHFLTSASLTLRGNRAFANLLGRLKEQSDANGGSGFSFRDIAANRAGIRFAQRATASAEEARRIQRHAAHGLAEGDIMPTLKNLPEGLTQAEFTARYGQSNDDGKRYRRVIRLIERRIDRLPLYQR